MWPHGISLLETFAEKIHQLLLLNTINQRPEGLSFSDFKQFLGREPPIKMYRMLKKLEEEGFLTTQPEAPQSSGRPKQLYILTTTGVQKLQELRTSLKEILEGIQSRFPNETQNVSISEFLEKGTFHHLRTPAEFIILNDSIPAEKKHQILTEMEKMLQTEIEKIRTALQKLEVSK